MQTKPSDTVFSTVFRYNFRLEVDNDVISGMAVDNVGMNVRIKFGEARLNDFRGIRGADFVSNERTWDWNDRCHSVARPCIPSSPLTYMVYL